MDAGLAALAGAAIGALAGMFGPLYSARQDRRERDEVRRRAVQGAARAWRDDFFSFQTFIADVFAARERGHRAPPAPHPFATDAHLIVIAENVPQRRAWTRVVASRASLHRVQAGPETMPDSDLALAFVELDKGRAAPGALRQELGGPRTSSAVDGRRAAFASGRQMGRPVRLVRRVLASGRSQWCPRPPDVRAALV